MIDSFYMNCCRFLQHSQKELNICLERDHQPDNKLLGQDQKELNDGLQSILAPDLPTDHSLAECNDHPQEQEAAKCIHRLDLLVSLPGAADRVYSLVAGVD